MSDEIKVGDRFQEAVGGKVWCVHSKRIQGNHWNVVNDADRTDKDYVSTSWLLSKCLRLPPKEDFKPGDRFQSLRTDVIWILKTFDPKFTRWEAYTAELANRNLYVLVSELQDRQLFRRLVEGRDYPAEKAEGLVKVGDRYLRVHSNEVYVLAQARDGCPLRWRAELEEDRNRWRSILHEDLLNPLFYRRLEALAAPPPPPEPTREQIEADLADKEYERIRRHLNWDLGSRTHDPTVAQLLAPLDSKTFLLRGR